MGKLGSMLQFEYTDHAEEKLAERNLDKKLIESVILEADKVIESRLGRRIAQKRIGNKLLRVVYEEGYQINIIITAYYTDTERY